ncbi:hypothetical protein EMIT0232MI5_130089 [Pseudomonas sp. IT-232MI5]
MCTAEAVKNRNISQTLQLEIQGEF